MKEIPLTRGKVAIVDDDVYDWAMQWKWMFHPNYAPFRHVRKKEKAALGDKAKGQVYLSREIAGITHLDNVEVSTHNDNKLDCRRDNLKVAMRGRGRKARRIADKPGVAFDHAKQCWEVIWLIEGQLHSCYEPDFAAAAKKFHAVA